MKTQAPPSQDEKDYVTAKREFEISYFQALIQTHGPRVSVLAKISGFERTHLYRKLEALGICLVTARRIARNKQELISREYPSSKDLSV